MAFWKIQTTATIKDAWQSGAREMEKNRRSTEDSGGCETTLHGTVTVATIHITAHLSIPAVRKTLGNSDVNERG